MKQGIVCGRLIAPTTLLLLTITRFASAQSAGTNTTPPPIPSPGAPSAYDSPTLAPSAAVADEPVIDTYTTRRTLPNRPLLITGVVLLGASYGASTIVAAASRRTEDEKLYYPVVGPWMDLADRNCGLTSCSGSKALHQALLVGDGVVQGLGALTVLLSLFIPEKTTRHWYLIGNNTFRIAPQIGSVTGVGAAGIF